VDDRGAVGFLKRLRGEQSRNAEALTLHAAGTVDVVGESFRQDALERVAKVATGPEPYLEQLKGRARSRTRNPKLLWFQAALLREPSNPHDRNAIAVHASGVGHVGYLDRETAIQYLPVFDELASQGVAVGACPGFLTGEPGVTTLGVVLCLSSPEAVIGDLRGE
jgi:HIRAN domain